MNRHTFGVLDCSLRVELEPEFPFGHSHDQFLLTSKEVHPNRGADWQRTTPCWQWIKIASNKITFRKTWFEDSWNRLRRTYKGHQWWWEVQSFGEDWELVPLFLGSSISWFFDDLQKVAQQKINWPFSTYRYENQSSLRLWKKYTYPSRWLERSPPAMCSPFWINFSGTSMSKKLEKNFCLFYFK